MINIPTIKPLSSRTDAEKAAARENDRATHKTLRAMGRANQGCADCTSRSSGWGVLPHGVFVCIHCAQLHRHIGRHISQTKAFNTGTYLWYEDEVAAMKNMGNARANAVYASKAKGAPPRPDENAPRDEKLAYVRAKYEKRRWFDPNAADPLAPTADNAGDTVAQGGGQKPKPKPKPAKAGRRRPARPVRARPRSLLGGANKASSNDGWAEWGTTASEAYDSAHEAAQAASPPRAKAAKKKAKADDSTPEEDVDLLDFNDLAISVPTTGAAEGKQQRDDDAKDPQAKGAPLDGDAESPLDGDYAKKQAFVLSVMRGTGPMVHGGVANSSAKRQACRLFGPPTAATRSHVAPPPQKIGGTGFFESFGLAS